MPGGRNKSTAAHRIRRATQEELVELRDEGVSDRANKRKEMARQRGEAIRQAIEEILNSDGIRKKNVRGPAPYHASPTQDTGGDLTGALPPR